MADILAGARWVTVSYYDVWLLEVATSREKFSIKFGPYCLALVMFAKANNLLDRVAVDHTVTNRPNLLSEFESCKREME